MADAAALLLGTWHMTSWKREILATGEKIDALGPDPVGYINYGPDGRFYALVVSRDRVSPTTLPPSDVEKLRLFDSMLAYTGTYSVDDEKAIHHVDASWNQAWTGTDQIRFYKLEGDELTISGAPARDPHSPPRPPCACATARFLREHDDLAIDALHRAGRARVQRLGQQGERDACDPPYYCQ